MKRLKNEYHLLQTSTVYNRKATIDDVSLIVEFIKAIASYEGMADRITATENLQSPCFFGNKPAAKVSIRYFENRPVYGNIIPKFLAQLALGHHFARLEWVALVWNNINVACYRKTGAKI